MLSWLPLLTVASALVGLQGVDARQMRKSDLHARQMEAAQRFHREKREVATTGVKNITFTNPKASGGFLFFWGLELRNRF